MIIDGIEYEPVATNGSRKQIVILHRGFVFVGDVSSEGEYRVIRNAQNIRKWGTNNGLGELALRGPLPDTILDKAGTVRYHHLAEIGAIDCDENHWA